MVWHPSKYAELLAERMRHSGCQAWLINTGWTGGPYGVGQRMKLAYTRAMIDAIHSGEMASVDFETDPVFGLAVPRSVPGVPSEVLSARKTWADGQAYDAMAAKLAGLFKENFKKYAAGTDKRVLEAGPV
jgi:phosphoenolpyruvate carboxykinase (ATP)